MGLGEDHSGQRVTIVLAANCRSHRGHVAGAVIRCNDGLADLPDEVWIPLGGEPCPALGGRPGYPVVALHVLSGEDFPRLSDRDLVVDLLPEPPPIRNVTGRVVEPSTLRMYAVMSNRSPSSR